MIYGRFTGILLEPRLSNPVWQGSTETPEGADPPSTWITIARVAIRSTNKHVCVYIYIYIYIHICICIYRYTYTYMCIYIIIIVVVVVVVTVLMITTIIIDTRDGEESPARKSGAAKGDPATIICTHM